MKHLDLLFFFFFFFFFCVLDSTAVPIVGQTQEEEEEEENKPFLIDCGSSGPTTTSDGRVWTGDSLPGSSSSSSTSNFSLDTPGLVASIPRVSSSDPTYGPLYKSARLFNASSRYSFTLLPNRTYCLRLHFSPFPFLTLNPNDSLFDVSANGLKLLSKFNPPRQISHRRSITNASSLVKEYFLNLTSDRLALDLVPIPASFAFLNAIEVVPVIGPLFADHPVNKVGSPGIKSSLSLPDRGIETMFRLNVGGPEIPPGKDRLLWRSWESDEQYMFSLNAATNIANTSNISYASPDIIDGPLVAPLLVYETARIMTNNEVVEKRFNLSWRFDVDPSFEYLIRLHFCELFYDKAEQRDFRIYINNKTAAEDYDVFVRAGGMDLAYHEDYFDSVSSLTDTLWVQVGPDSLTSGSGIDALLNGLEIFKLSRNLNLADTSERIDPGGQGYRAKRPKSKVLVVAIGVGATSLLSVSIVSAVVFFFVCRRKRKSIDKKDRPSGWQPLFLHDAMGSTKNARSALKPVLKSSLSSGSHRTGRMFALTEIRAATRNFDESLVIGNGGFGKVYKGEMEPGNLVAIKRAHPTSQQGLAEFETEIEMLSKLRHRHLVSLIGYCEEKKEMILVYEYMANGTLRSHIYGSNLPALSWKQRIEACIGAARGLHYLHTGAERGIIHRDVKTTNILLDDNFVAKMSDFGLSKAGPSVEHTHVSTAVKGSFGYLDPEYFRRQQLTQKSDVYSFGVVLFEVMCARPVINPSLPKDQINLAEWAVRWQRQRSLESIIDPRLEGDCSVESLRKFGEIAEKCLSDEGRMRPSMGEVLWHLEYVLHLHHAYTKSADGDSFTDLSFSLPFIDERELRGGQDGARTLDEDVTEGVVKFQQLKGPEGR